MMNFASRTECTAAVEDMMRGVSAVLSQSAAETCRAIRNGGGAHPPHACAGIVAFRPKLRCTAESEQAERGPFSLAFQHTTFCSAAFCCNKVHQDRPRSPSESVVRRIA